MKKIISERKLLNIIREAIRRNIYTYPIAYSTSFSENDIVNYLMQHFTRNGRLTIYMSDLSHYDKECGFLTMTIGGKDVTLYILWEIDGEYDDGQYNAHTPSEYYDPRWYAEFNVNRAYLEVDDDSERYIMTPDFCELLETALDIEYAEDAEKLLT